MPVCNPLSADVVQIIGRNGEEFVYRFLLDQYSTMIKLGQKEIIWVNKLEESGLPYDLVVRSNDKLNGDCSYVEVKATRTRDKSFFEISHREWSFAQLEVSFCIELFISFIFSF